MGPLCGDRFCLGAHGAWWPHTFTESSIHEGPHPPGMNSSSTWNQFTRAKKSCELLECHGSPSDGPLGLGELHCRNGQIWAPLAIYFMATTFFFAPRNFVFNFFQEKKNWEIFGKTFSSVNLTEFCNVWKKLSI